MPVPEPESREPASSESIGGWRSQSVWLKLMLAVSLVFVALGVYRCSMELEPPDGPRLVRVERATVDAPDSLFAVPADSMAALTSRLFARELGEASGIDVTLQQDPSTWAVVRLHVRALPDSRIELAGTAASVLGGRRLAVVSAVDSPDRLREMAAAAARDMASELDAIASQVTRQSRAERQ